MGVSDTFKSWQAGACSWQAYGKLGPDSWCRVRTVQSGLVLRHVKCLGRPTNLRTFRCLRRQVLHVINGSQRALRPKRIWPSHSVGPCLSIHASLHVMSMSCQLIIPKIIPAVTCNFSNIRVMISSCQVTCHANS